MRLGEDYNWSLGVPQVPNLEFRYAFVIIGNCHLCWNFWVPGEAYFSVFEGAAILERENTLVDFQVPDDGEAILAGGGKDVRDFAVPRDGCD
jgi:hypothetical protein